MKYTYVLTQMMKWKYCLALLLFYLIYWISNRCISSSIVIPICISKTMKNVSNIDENDNWFLPIWFHKNHINQYYPLNLDIPCDLSNQFLFAYKLIRFFCSFASLLLFVFSIIKGLSPLLSTFFRPKFAKPRTVRYWGLAPS